MNTRMLNATVLLASAVLSACAGVPEVRLETEKFQAAGKNMASSTHTQARQFHFYTKGDQAAAATAAAMGAIPVFGVLGAAIAGGTIGAISVAAKNARLGFTIDQFSKDNNIVDPKFAIEKSLGDEMANKYKVVYSGTAGTAIPSNANLDDLIAANSSIPYVLDVSTLRWVLTESEEDQFVMNYTAKLMLVDTANKTTVAQGVCTYASPKTVIELPKLKTNDVSQLNDEITQAIAACINQFSVKTLALKSEPATSASR